MKSKASTPKRPKGARDPHEVRSLLRAVHYAMSGLLDSRASLTKIEEMYAVFEEASAVCALAVLLVGFSRHASDAVLTAEERPHTILLHIHGRRRKRKQVLTFRNLLPGKRAHKMALDRWLTKNRSTYCLATEGDVLTLTVSFPRFLSDNYDVSAVSEEDTWDRFYDIMLLLSGDTPENELP